MRQETAGSNALVRSAYLEQVGRIAPEELHGRDGELAELAAFCTEPDRGPYVWWRAPAWAGKSALMSWFVLHLPPGVQVVSFFVTARYKGQDDRDAFTNVVMEQLADLLEQPIPAYLTETTREPYLLRMLALAAEECQCHDQRLVLVVDGLDEDRGVTTDPDAYSIAALLPTRPQAGLRVIVSGRPDPPVPADVPHHHPLRDPSIVRVLGMSGWADVVKADMQRELKRLLHGNQAEQDLLGLVTAAGGGLSAGDLASLTGLSVYDIEDNLHAVAGRTFTSRASLWQPGTAPLVYVLGHEELQTAATTALGQTRLEQYRQRLHAWAEDYRRRAWPAGTPEYLLRGYFRMLYDAADIPRLLTCATDQLRHDRMLDITGGDTAALTEITDVQDLLLRLEEPDIPALARLNVHRTLIGERNAHVPVTLPALWTRIGNPERAEALASAITDPDRQAHALGILVWVTADAGDLDRARVLARRAATAARAIRDPERQAQILGDLARAATDAGDLDRARALARQAMTAAWAIYDRSRQAQVLADLVQATADAGDLDRAEAAAQAITSPYWQAQALGDLARAAAGAGDLERARTLAERAEVAARAIGAERQAQVLGDLARAAAGAGDLERARTLAGRAEAASREIPDPYWRAQALAIVARAAADAGDLDQARTLAERAEVTARTITDPVRQAQVLGDLARAAADAGDLERARTLAERAEVAARTITNPVRRAQVLGDLARAAATAGDLDRARTLAGRAEAASREISDPEQRAQALAIVARTAADAGDLDRARTLAERAEAASREISDPDQRAQALAVLARAVADAGDLDRARALVGRGETAARAITDPYWQAQALDRSGAGGGGRR